MPSYIYECKNCGEVIDVHKKMSDPDPEVCNQCGHRELVQVLQPTNFRITGSGVYNPTTEWNKS